MTYDVHQVLAQESAAFARAAQRGLDAPVPSCPDWDVLALVQHLGVVQRSHASHVTRGVTDPPTGERPVAPEDDVLAWFEQGTQVLLNALQELPPEAPAWNWASQTPQVVGFWPRRMALEAAVHRWDAENAHGPAAGFDVPVAVDGIDEVLGVFRPARLRHRAGTASGIVRIVLTDSEASWTLELTPGDLTPRQQPPDAVLTGTSSEVFLALWGRRPMTTLSVAGEQALVTALPVG